MFGLPSNIGTHKDNADPHDGEEGLKGDVVLDAGHGGALWGCGVVQLPTSLAHQVGVVCSTEDPGQNHLEIFYQSVTQSGITWPRNESRNVETEHELRDVAA